MASDDDFRQQLAELSARIAALEAAVGARSNPAAVESVAPSPATVVLARPQGSGSVPAAAPNQVSSLESRIGAHLLNRIGIVAVLIGMAWFLKLAFDRDWIGPEIRILTGLAGAAVLIGWSERFRRRGFPAFSYSLKALGTGVAYLSLWAAFSVFHLAPAWIVFLAMTAVTVTNAVLARQQESELLAIYALAGGLATPALLSMRHGSEVFLFSYLALLAGGALLLLARYPWKRLAWAALLGTAVYYTGGIFSEEEAARLPIAMAFLGLFFAGFATMAFLILRRTDSRSMQNSPFPVLFPIVNAVAAWAALMVLLGTADLRAGRPWATVALAAACFLLAVVSRVPVALTHTYLGLGVLFVTIAVPLQVHGHVVTLCWLTESLVLLVVAKARSDAAMRVLASVVLGVAGFSLLRDWLGGSLQPVAVVANIYFGSNLIAACVFAVVMLLSLGELDGRPETPRTFGSWNYLAAFGSVAFSLTLLVAVSLEIHHYWFCGAGFFRDFCGGYGHRERRAIAAGFSYSAWYMLYGAALMTAGFLRHSAFLRWQALGLLAFSIGKVFLNGASSGSQGYRVLSFLALGVLLLAVSFVYQRNWLRLRG